MKSIYDRLNRYYGGAWGGDASIVSSVAWTPTISVSGGTAPQYSTVTCSYSLYGKMVKYSILLSGDGGAEGAGTNPLLISLPLPASSLSGFIGSGFGLNSTTYISVIAIFNSSTTLKLIIQSTGGEVQGVSQNSTTRAISLWGAYWIE